MEKEKRNRAYKQNALRYTALTFLVTMLGALLVAGIWIKMEGESQAASWDAQREYRYHYMLITDSLEMEQNYEDLRALAAAVENGKAVLADQTADQEAVDKAAYAILDELFAVAKTADVQSLESLIQAAKGLLDKNFTSDSLKNLQDAISQAEAVVADANRDQAAIGNAYKDLVDAIRKLERKGNKAALKAIIEKAEGILEQADAYTASSLEGLDQALSEAKTVYDNEDAVQSAVNEAVETLTWQVTEARLLGDVDGNGAVTTSDTAAVLRASAELAVLSEVEAQSADVNGDGVADTKDAALILQYAGEKISAF